MVDRSAPQDLDAEQAVLGAILIDKDAMAEVADFLRPDDFYRSAHGLAFGAMLRLYERREPIDIVTVASALGDDLEGAGGAGYLSKLGNDTPTAIHVEQYGRIVEQRAVMRRLIQVAGSIAALGYACGDASETVDAAQALLFDVGQRQSSRWDPLSGVMQEAYDHLERIYKGAGAPTGVPTGFSGLDRLTGGFTPGDLIIVAARPSVGKTALALAFAEHAARKGIGVGLFSLEMSRESLALRMLAGAARIDVHNRIDCAAFERAMDSAADLSGLPIWIDDSPTATPLELRTRARRLAAEHRNMGLLIVDYLQLATTKAESRVQEVTQISRGLKSLAREMKVPLVAISQLSRGPEHRDTGEPRLSDLRDSGAIEQDADVVIFLWRANEESMEPVVTVNVKVAKQRNGPTGKLELAFDRLHTRFAEQERDYGPSSYAD